MGSTSGEKDRIAAQSNVLEQILSNRINSSEHTINFDIIFSEQFFRSIANIHIVASGSSKHAGDFGRRLFDSLTTVETTVHPSTEYTLDTICRPEQTLVIGVSRSGETADVISALRTANSCGAPTLGITSTTETSMEKVTDSVVMTEIPDTVAINDPLTFTTTSTVFSLFALFVGTHRDDIASTETQDVIDNLEAIPTAIEAVFDHEEAIQDIADQYSDTDTIICLGRQFSTPVAVEAAHQLTRSAEIMAEGLPAGELKHSLLPVVNENIPVLVTAVNGSSPDLMEANVKEVLARDAPVIGVISDDTHEFEFTERFVMPETGQFESLVASVYWQLFIYYLSNPDYNGNLSG